MQVDFICASWKIQGQMHQVATSLKTIQVLAFCSQIKVIPLKLFYYQTFFETWCD